MFKSPVTCNVQCKSIWLSCDKTICRIDWHLDTYLSYGFTTCTDGNNLGLNIRIIHILPSDIHTNNSCITFTLKQFPNNSCAIKVSAGTDTLYALEPKTNLLRHQFNILQIQFTSVKHNEFDIPQCAIESTSNTMNSIYITLHCYTLRSINIVSQTNVSHWNWN